MSAITPYLNELMERDLDEEDAGDDYFNCGTGGSLSGSLSGLGAGKRCKTPLTVVNETHKSQSFTMYVRQAAAQILARPDRTLQPAFDGNKAVLLINPIVTADEAPPWSPLGKDGKIGVASILANVSKLGCPSFSLPAGSNNFFGSCPGAVHGMTIESSKVLRDVGPKDAIAAAVGSPPAREDSLERWYAGAVCQHCYATRSNYGYFSKQVLSLAVYSWTRKAVADGTFVPFMIEAIERSPFHQGGQVDPGLARHLKQRLQGTGYQRVFRLHDSGDFFSPQYVEAWKQIADHFMPGKGSGTPTIFWAPTRLWAAGSNRKWLNVFGPAGDLRTNNVVIRPSGYHVNERAPLPIVGETKGSTVHDVGGAVEAQMMEAKVFDYVCPASRKEAKAKTCLDVLGPDGEMGCRACWVRTDMTISYHIH